MWSPSAILLSALASSTIVQGISLSDALKQAGASEFADLITSDSVLAALYNSSQVQTVFAPVDGSLVTRKSRKRQSLAARRAAQAQSSKDLTGIAAASKENGQAIPNNDPQANLNGQPQNVVSNPLNTTQSNVAKRQESEIITTVLPAETITITFQPLTPDCTTTTTILPAATTITVYASSPTPSSLPSLLKIYAGLGNSVNVIKGDIAYDGGLIHLVDDYFTLPETVTDTAIADNHTTFAQLSASANLTSSINNTPEITCFIPTNAAFAANSNSTSSYASTSSLLSGHIIPNFLGYLPALTNGATFTTQGGGNVTVTQTGNDFFINNAKIIASNLIVENGVCHVIDAIITPTLATPIPFTGNAMPAAKRNIATAIALWGFAIALSVAMLI